MKINLTFILSNRNEETNKKKKETARDSREKKNQFGIFYMARNKRS